MTGSIEARMMRKFEFAQGLDLVDRINEAVSQFECIIIDLDHVHVEISRDLPNAWRYTIITGASFHGCMGFASPGDCVRRLMTLWVVSQTKPVRLLVP